MGQIFMLSSTTVSNQVTPRKISLVRVVQVNAPFRSSTIFHRKRQKNEMFKNIWVLLDTCSSASILKMHIWQQMPENATQKAIFWCWQTLGIYILIWWETFYYFQWNFTSMNHIWQTSFLLGSLSTLRECTSIWTNVRKKLSMSTLKTVK